MNRDKPKKLGDRSCEPVQTAKNVIYISTASFLNFLSTDTALNSVPDNLRVRFSFQYVVLQRSPLKIFISLFTFNRHIKLYENEL